MKQYYPVNPELEVYGYIDTISNSIVNQYEINSPYIKLMYTADFKKASPHEIKQGLSDFFGIQEPTIIVERVGKDSLESLQGYNFRLQYFVVIVVFGDAVDWVIPR